MRDVTRSQQDRVSWIAANSSGAVMGSLERILSGTLHFQKVRTAVQWDPFARVFRGRWIRARTHASDDLRHL